MQTMMIVMIWMMTIPVDEDEKESDIGGFTLET